MSVMETLNTRRTYRRFAQKPVPQDVVNDMVEALRLSSCGANRQAVKLVVVQSPEMVAKVHPLVKWAAYLPPEQGAPKADEQPVMYLAVVQDSSIPGDLNTDTGIALANITLAAWAKGVGSCIMGAINKPVLSELLGIAAPDKLAFMVALGCPTHAARVVPMTEKTGIKYYLDENGDYCVPKRSREELARRQRGCLSPCGGSVALSLPSPSPAVTPLPKGEAFASGQTERFCIYTSLSSFILHNCLQFGFNLMEFLHNT